MKKKHNRSSLEALLAVQTAPTVKYTAPQGRETLSSFTREYEAAEQRKKDAEEQARLAPVKAAEQQLTETLKALRREQAQALQTVESYYLNTECPLIQDGDFTAQDSVEAIRVRVRNAFDAARQTLEETDGVRLEQGALERCQRVSKLNLQVSWVTPKAWETLIRHMIELGAFSPHDVTHLRAAQPVEQPVQETPVNTLDALDALPNSREGERAARELALRHYLSVEASEMFFKWLKHLYDDYNGFSPNEEQKKAAIQFFQTWNRSYLNYQSWDECRRYLVAAHVFPSHLLTPDEKLSIELEDADLTDRNVRVEFARRSRLINGR